MNQRTEPFSTDFQRTSSPPRGVSTLHEQGSGLWNEDVLVCARDLYGVFDGATSIGKPPVPGEKTGGLRAAEIAARTFLHGRGSLAEQAALANGRIRKAQIRRHVNLEERQHLWSTSMAVVRIKGPHLEYCRTGDCMILLLHEDGTRRLLTPELDIDGETLLLLRESGASTDPCVQQSLSEQILKVRLQMNVRYGVLNGEPGAIRFLDHGQIPLSGISDILLFTDGLFLPREDPATPGDWDFLSLLYQTGGLSMIRDYVRVLQMGDPDCRKYPRFKPHDDIAAISIGLASGGLFALHGETAEGPGSSSLAN